MDFLTGLPVSTDWKGNIFDLILVIVDRLMRIVHYEPVLYRSQSMPQASPKSLLKW